MARLGGDEFAIVQAEPDGTEGAARSGPSHPRRAGEADASGRTRSSIRPRASESWSSPADDASTEHFVKNADLAMYRAKTEGRNSFQFYSQWMNAASPTRGSDLESCLRAALAGQEFVLRYQPQCEPGRRSDHRRGSPRALATSRARIGHALSVHPGRRRQRPDRPPGSMGVAPSVCPVPSLAGRRLAPDCAST